MPKVLIADDDDAVLEPTARMLRRAGHTVVTAVDAVTALRALAEDSFDVIISDIHLPDLSGLDLLREARARDLDVPVILMTGGASMESAIAAVELGAFRYLQKPFEPAALADLVARAAQLYALAAARRVAFELAQTNDPLLGSPATLPQRFDEAVRSLWIAFQPIVSLSGERVVAYEALMRTEEQSLRSPLAFLAAAERLQRVHELSRAVRAAVARAAVDCPSDATLFVNLHATDLADDALFEVAAPLSAIAPRVVLEITERASLEHVAGVNDAISTLRRLGFRIAVDDLGAGYAGLTTLTALSPEVVKIDMSLVRNIHEDTKRQHVVKSLIELSGQLAVQVVLEGIETAQERDCIANLGGNLLQGWHFGHPTRAFSSVPPSAFARATKMSAPAAE